VAIAAASITGMGAATPIGRGAWIAAAAARAGLCGFREHPYMIDTAGEPMRIARVPWLDVELQGVERFAQLLFPAIDEALQSAPPHSRIALTLGLPPPRPGLVADLATQLKQLIGERYAGRLAPILTYEAGHAAGLLALDAALKGLAAGSIQACIVAGVDSYISPETLEWIEACDQLHGGGPLNNAWGFIPGEAAGALLVQPLVSGREGADTWLADVVSVGIGQETKLIKTDAVCIGEGLTQAFRSALSKLQPGERIDDVYCDMNGEAYRADEYGFTCLRTKERFREATDFVAPADCWGDVGAASGLLHAQLAVAARRKGYAAGELAMVWASSEGGERAAGLIQAPVTPRE
jgi:3-oxoacyl-[acyl-carrier-protein] synthase I